MIYSCCTNNHSKFEQRWNNSSNVNKTNVKYSLDNRQPILYSQSTFSSQQMEQNELENYSLGRFTTVVSI